MKKKEEISRGGSGAWRRKYACQVFSMENLFFHNFHFRENPCFRDEFQALPMEEHHVCYGRNNPICYGRDNPNIRHWLELQLSIFFTSQWPYNGQGAELDKTSKKFVGRLTWGQYHGSRRLKWRQFSVRHSTIATRQTEYHEALPSLANVQSHLTSLFADDGNASWYLVCQVPILILEWRLDCEYCRHLTVIGLHDPCPWTL